MTHTQTASDPSRVQRLSQTIAEISSLLHPCPPSLIRDVKEVVNMLFTMGDKYPKVRFHLLLDKDSESRSAPEFPIHSHIRILYSPTLSLDHPGSRDLAMQIAGLLGLLARRKRNRMNDSIQGPSSPTTSPQDRILPIPPPEILLRSNANRSQADLGIVQNSQIPEWFPGRANRDTENTINIKQTDFRIFQALDDISIKWLYEFFFTQAQYAAVRKHPNRRHHGIYEQFTAPWFSGKLLLDGVDQAMTVTSVANMRNLRGQSGPRRMRLTLAAYYEMEPYFTKEVLEYCVRHISFLKRSLRAGRRGNSHRKAAPKTQGLSVVGSTVQKEVNGSAPEVPIAATHVPQTSQHPSRTPFSSPANHSIHDQPPNSPPPTSS